MCAGARGVAQGLEVSLHAGEMVPVKSHNFLLDQRSRQVRVKEPFCPACVNPDILTWARRP